jgi:hypothetical protein
VYLGQKTFFLFFTPSYFVFPKLSPVFDVFPAKEKVTGDLKRGIYLSVRGENKKDDCVVCRKTKCQV